MNKFTVNGSYFRPHGDGSSVPTLDKGCLFDKYLLVPLKRILSLERWGYDRDGTNSVSRPIDFDLSIDTDKYKEIEQTDIVFLITQYAGWLLLIHGIIFYKTYLDLYIFVFSL